MPYIGTQPLTGQFKKLDSISVVNGQAAYTLNYNSAAYKPATANALLVSVNGVIQAAGDAYTISGSTITFTENLVTGDVIDFIIALGDTGSAVTPVDGSVTTAKLGDDSVTKAKMGTTELDLATIKDSTGNTTALTIDSSGRVFKPATPAFHAYADDGNYITTTPIPYDNTTINVGNAFDTTNYKYVVPVSGNYFIAVHFGIVRDDASGGESLNIELKKNGTRIQRGYFEEVSSTGYGNVSFSAIHVLAAGDELTVTAGGSVDYFAAAADTIFSGYLIG